jgi:hypothetical protein
MLGFAKTLVTRSVNSFGAHREVPEGKSGRVSWPLLGAHQEVASKAGTDQRAMQSRSMIVRRRICKKIMITQTKRLLPKTTAFLL